MLNKVKGNRMQYLFLTIAALSLSVQAQNAIPTTFPGGTSTPTADELRVRLSGNVFSVKPFSGPDWRLQYKESGYYFVNAGSYSDSGQWKTEDGKLCSKGSKSPAASCNEVRATSESLYYKRDSGEIITLVKQ